MASQTSGGALDDILQDRAALETHFGIHLNSDESDLDISFSKSDWSDSGMTKIIIDNHKIVTKQLLFHCSKPNTSMAL